MINRNIIVLLFVVPFVALGLLQQVRAQESLSKRVEITGTVTFYPDVTGAAIVKVRDAITSTSYSAISKDELFALLSPVRTQGIGFHLHFDGDEAICEHSGEREPATVEISTPTLRATMDLPGVNGRSRLTVYRPKVPPEFDGLYRCPAPKALVIPPFLSLPPEVQIQASASVSVEQVREARLGTTSWFYQEPADQPRILRHVLRFGPQNASERDSYFLNYVDTPIGLLPATVLIVNVSPERNSVIAIRYDSLNFEAPLPAGRLDPIISANEYGSKIIVRDERHSDSLPQLVNLSADTPLSELIARATISSTDLFSETSGSGMSFPKPTDSSNSSNLVFVLAAVLIAALAGFAVVVSRWIRR